MRKNPTPTRCISWRERAKWSWGSGWHFKDEEHSVYFCFTDL